jgi:hypothetical protein
VFFYLFFYLPPVLRSAGVLRATLVLLMARNIIINSGVGGLITEKKYTGNGWTFKIHNRKTAVALNPCSFFSPQKSVVVNPKMSPKTKPENPHS